MNELFKIDMDKREIVLNYKHYNVNIDVLNFIVDLLKKQEAYENMRKEAIEYVKDSIEDGNYIEDDIDTDVSKASYDKYINSVDLLNILNKVGDSDE